MANDYTTNGAKLFVLGRIVLLCVMAACFLGCCGVHRDWSPEEFADKDLRSLDDEAKVRLKSHLTNTLPREYPWGGRREPDPWNLWRHRSANGQSIFIVFEGHRLVMTPSASAISIHLLDSSGRRLGSSEFLTGWRLDVVSAAFHEPKNLALDVIEVRSSPDINGGNVRRQYYGVLGNRVALLRLEDQTGALVENVYHGSHLTIGPKVPVRTAHEWEQVLGSNDTFELLECLTWLGGVHCPISTPPELDLEDPEWIKLVAELRSRPSVRKTIEMLTESTNSWVSEAARAAQQQIRE